MALLFDPASSNAALQLPSFWTCSDATKCVLSCTANFKLLMVIPPTFVQGWTPLMFACYEGHLPVAEFLILQGGNVFAPSKVS